MNAERRPRVSGPMFGAVLFVLVAIALVVAGVCSVVSVFTGDGDTPVSPTSVADPSGDTGATPGGGAGEGITEATVVATAVPERQTARGAAIEYINTIAVFDIRPAMTDPDLMASYEADLLTSIRDRAGGDALTELERVMTLNRVLDFSQRGHVVRQTVDIRSVEVRASSGRIAVVRADVVMRQQVTDGIGGFFPSNVHVIMDYEMQQGTDDVWRVVGWNLILSEAI